MTFAFPQLWFALNRRIGGGKRCAGPAARALEPCCSFRPAGRTLIQRSIRRASSRRRLSHWNKSRARKVASFEELGPRSGCPGRKADCIHRVKSGGCWAARRGIDRSARSEAVVREGLLKG